MRLGLSCVGLAKLDRLAGRPPRRSEPDAADRAAVVRAIDGVSRRLPGMTCLTQALAARAMLTRRGIPARLRIGVRPGASLSSPLDAHAWIESDGRLLVGDRPNLDAYLPLAASGTAQVDSLAALIRGETVRWSALGADARSLLDYCEAEDLTGLVHEALAGQPELDWPLEIREEIGSRAHASAAIELTRLQELRRVIAALDAAGVRATIYKGSALAYLVYAEPWLRPRADTDVLIPAADRAAAMQALAAAGYALTPASPGDLLFRQCEFQRRDAHGVVHAIDLHWQISNQERFARIYDDLEIWGRAVPVPALGAAARAADLADALLIACVHPAMHHRNEMRLIWACDVHGIASAMHASDWTAFVERARAKAVAAVCLHHLTRARTWLGTAVPASVTGDLVRAAATREPSAEYLAPDRHWRDEVASNFRALPTWRARARLLRQMLLPPASHVRRAYSLEHSALGWILLPALYAHRGLKAFRWSSAARTKPRGPSRASAR